jgi:hypothetical protein
MKLRHLHSGLVPTFLLVSCVAALVPSVPLRAQSTTVTANPANGATGVGRDVPMVFTFSKAIDTEASSASFIQMMPTTAFLEVTTTWADSNKRMTCTPVGGNWPAGATIQWILSATDVDGVEITEPPFGIPPMGTFTTGSGGGSTDTNAPVLVSSFPANNATGVPINSTIRFTFNEAMQAAQSIEWSPNLTAATFNYTWSADSKMLTCDYATNLPSNATITWKLNPASGPVGFQDLAGNPLAMGVYLGSFVTSTVITNDPCNPEPSDRTNGAFSISKFVQYAQTGTSAPVEDGEFPAVFDAVMSSPTNNPATGGSLKLPDNSTLLLTNFFGSFMAFDEYTNQVSLDAARPSGNYTLQVNRTTGGQQSTVLTITANDWPPTPEILNLPALQSINASNDFEVSWNGLVSPGPNDSIYFSIENLFHAPDLCVPRPLPNTAKSITVPAGTLASGQTYDATLMFGGLADFDTNSIPDFVCSASLSKSLSFQIQTSGGGSTQPKSPTIGAPTLTAGTLEFQITGAAPNQSLQVQGSSTLLPGSWTTLQTLTADASGTATFTESPIASQQYYRVVTPP